MTQFLPTKSLSYDDVNSVAQPQIDWQSDPLPQHRGDVPKELHRIIVSPMSAVVGKEFAIEAVKLGLSVCVPRFGTIEEEMEIIQGASKFCKDNFVYASVGLNDWDRVREINHDNILIDVANGYLNSVSDFASELQKRWYKVMVGNVHSADGCNLYSDCIVRVGIGGGSVCETSKVTSYTRGQITELIECCDREREHKKSKNRICADGGIRDSGCAMKAFGCGADYVMMGGYFSVAKEAENVRKGELSYWGGASEKQQILQYGEKRRHSEGREVKIDESKVKPLKELVDDLWGGISSGITYSGHRSLPEYIGNGVFEVKNSRG